MRVLWFLAALLCISHFTEACEIEAKGVDDGFKELIVNKHNELRAKVANGEEGGLPTAANMLEMVWDDKLAKKAQNWANKCVIKANNGDDGKTVAATTDQNDEPDWEHVLQMFFDEEKNFNSDNIGAYKSQMDSAQFTRAIWAKTNKVGCGYVKHTDGSNKIHLYGCHYSPTGNVIGQPIYELGDPCSSCGGCGTIEGLCEKISRRRRSKHEEEEDNDYDEDERDDDDDEDEGSDLFGFLNGVGANNNQVSDDMFRVNQLNKGGQSYGYGGGVDGDYVDIYINDYGQQAALPENNATGVNEDYFDIYNTGNEDVDADLGADYYGGNSGGIYRGDSEDDFEEDNDEEENEEEDIDQEDSDQEDSDQEDSDEEESDEEEIDEDDEE